MTDLAPIASSSFACRRAVALSGCPESIRESSTMRSSPVTRARARHRPALRLALGHENLLVREGGDLREVRHDEHLVVAPERRERGRRRGRPRRRRRRRPRRTRASEAPPRARGGWRASSGRARPPRRPSRTAAPAPRGSHRGAARRRTRPGRRRCAPRVAHRPGQARAGGPRWPPPAWARPCGGRRRAAPPASPKAASAACRLASRAVARLLGRLEVGELCPVRLFELDDVARRRPVLAPQLREQLEAPADRLEARRDPLRAARNAAGAPGPTSSTSAWAARKGAASSDRASWADSCATALPT